MSNVTIIEASRQNGIGSNSSWVNTYQQPVLVNTGDIVQMKQCFVDSSSSNSGNITIDNDVDLSIEMGYYLVNSPQPEGKVFEGDPKADVDYQPYIARHMHTLGDYTEFDPILKTWTYKLKAGTYTPALLAETLTRAFTTIKFKVDITNSYKTVQPHNPFMITTQEIGNDNGNIIFFLQDTAFADRVNAKKFYFRDSIGGILSDREFLGASMVSLIWNREGNSKFSFDYIHTPYVNSGQPCVSFIRKGDLLVTNNGKYMMFNRRGGVFFSLFKGF
jgi:hypothetical protein